MKIRLFTAFLIALALAATGGSTFAADHTTTSINFSWETGSAGWDTGSITEAWADGDNATFTINSAVARMVYFNSDIVADALTVTWGGSYNVAFTLNLQDYYHVELEESIEPKLTANSLVINGYNNQMTSIINGVLEVHNGISVTNSRLTIGNGGTLLAHSNITSTGFVSVANGGTLVLDPTGTGMTINQAVTITDGAVGAIKSVRGNNIIEGLVTIGANSSPGLVVESGSLSINGLVSKTTSGPMAKVQVNTGATLQIGAGGISAASGTPLFLYGGGVIELHGSLTNTGMVEIGVPAGAEEVTTTIRLMSSDFAAAGILSITARAILEIPEGVNITLNRTPTTGIISGYGTLLVKGTLDMLNGYNLGFFGNTHIDGGRVNLYGVGNGSGGYYYGLGHGTISFANGGILDLSGIDAKVDGVAFYATIDLNGGTIYMRGNQNIPYGDFYNEGMPAITNGDKGVVIVDMAGVANGYHCLFYMLDYRTVNFEFTNLTARQQITWLAGYENAEYTLSSVSFASVALGNTVTVPSGPITMGEYDHVAGTLNVVTGGTATVYGDVSGTVNVTGGVLHIGGAMSLDNQSITGVVQAQGVASSNAMVSVDAPRGVIVQGSGSVGAGLISLRNGIIYEGTELSDNINTLTSTLINYHGTADVVIDGTAQDDDRKAVIDGLFLADGASLSAAEARGHSLVITGSVTGTTDGEKSSQLILGADTLGMHQIYSAELQDIQVVVSGGHHLVIRDTHLDSGVSLLVDATSSVELGGAISIAARGVQTTPIPPDESETTSPSTVEDSGLTVSFDFISRAPIISSGGVLFVLDFANLTDVSWQALLDEAKAAYNDGISTVYSFGIDLGNLGGIDVTGKSVIMQFTYPPEWGYVLSFNDTMNLSIWDWANGAPDQMFLTYIPEPTTATLGMFGLAVMLLRRRRGKTLQT